MAAETYLPEIDEALTTVDTRMESHLGALPEAAIRQLGGLLSTFMGVPEEIRARIIAAHYGALGDPAQHIVAAAAFTLFDLARMRMVRPEDPDALVRQDLQLIEEWLSRHQPAERQ